METNLPVYLLGSLEILYVPILMNDPFSVCIYTHTYLSLPFVVEQRISVKESCMLFFILAEAVYLNNSAVSARGSCSSVTDMLTSV